MQPIGRSVSAPGSLPTGGRLYVVDGARAIFRGDIALSQAGIGFAITGARRPRSPLRDTHVSTGIGLATPDTGGRRQYLSKVYTPIPMGTPG